MSIETVPRFGVFEHLSRHRATIGNPFDVSVAGFFSPEKGKSVDVGGFYDGADSYRARFMPTRIGPWSYAIAIDGETVAIGSFHCEPSDLPGPLRQHSASPYHFQYADGSPYYMMGNTAYNGILTYRHRKQAFREFSDYYASRGFNWLRFALHQTKWPTLGHVVWPWGGTPADPDYKSLDVDLFRDADGMVKELASRGMIASLILFMPADRVLEGIAWESLQRYVRYAMARLGAYWNIAWNMANEWNREGIFTCGRMDALGRLVHRLDPYGRLIACHHHARFEFYDKEWTSMSSIQHRGLPQEINRIMLQNRPFNKIVINEEYGYEGDNHSPPNDPDNVRHDHWAIAMAGGYASYGDKTKGPKIGVYFSGDLSDSVGTQAPDALCFLPLFMRQVDYLHMVPANAFLSQCNPDEVFGLANPGKEYVVYFVRGQSATLSLLHARGTLAAQWYNPQTGQYSPDSRWKNGTFDATCVAKGRSGETSWAGLGRRLNVEFTAPDDVNDWVLHVKAVTT